MKEELNLLSHYQIHIKKDNTYEFTTSLGFIYEVYFTDASGYFPTNEIISNNIKTFGFELKNPLTKLEQKKLNKHLSKDLKIRATIEFIIRDFFIINPQGIIFYICQQIDFKQASRSKLFQKWFIELNLNNEFNSINDSIQDSYNNNTTFYSFLFKSSNIFRNEIEFEFYNLKNFDDK
jgi:hypothetical protein